MGPAKELEQALEQLLAKELEQALEQLLAKELEPAKDLEEEQLGPGP